MPFAYHRGHFVEADLPERSPVTSRQTSFPDKIAFAIECYGDIIEMSCVVISAANLEAFRPSPRPRVPSANCRRDTSAA
jgi:hypothetical protein